MFYYQLVEETFHYFTYSNEMTEKKKQVESFLKCLWKSFLVSLEFHKSCTGLQTDPFQKYRLVSLSSTDLLQRTSAVVCILSLSARNYLKSLGTDNVITFFSQICIEKLNSTDYNLEHQWVCQNILQGLIYMMALPYDFW